MKGDGKGAYPTLYDLKIIFKYKDEELPIIEDGPPPFVSEGGKTCPSTNVQSTVNLSGKNNNGSNGDKLVYTFSVPEFINGEDVVLPSLKGIQFQYVLKGMTIYRYDNLVGQYVPVLSKSELQSNDCGYIVYDIEVLNERTGNPPVKNICGSGSTTSNYYGNNPKQVYSFYLNKVAKISEVSIDNSVKGYKILSVSYEYSHKGSPYVVADSLWDIPSESCVNIVYHLEAIKEKCEFDCGVNPPKVHTCDETKNCKIPEKCNENCISFGPKCITGNCDKTGNPSIPEDEDELCETDTESCQVNDCFGKCTTNPPEGGGIKDPEWTTVETLRFFGQAPLNQSVRWISALHKHTIHDKVDTRIVYRYSKSNGYHWTSEYEDFETTGVANNVMAIAYIQVRTTKVQGYDETKYPKVDSFLFTNERGDVDVDMNRPQILIIPIKDNNINNQNFSDNSKINWTFTASDPRGFAILNDSIEWDGDIREQYPVGTYKIKARIKNEVGLWSNLTEYTLVVKQEKPVVVLDTVDSKKYFATGEKVDFDFSKSYDPDGDRIVEIEWKNKKSTYSNEDLGALIVQLRIKDSEGHWSDWVSKEISIYDQNENFWFIDGEPALLTEYANAFDLDSSTSVGIMGNTITWSKDISERIVEISTYSVENAGSKIDFYDSNNKLMNVLSTKVVSKEKSTSFTNSVIGSRYDRTKFSIVIPEGAVKMVFTNHTSVDTVKLKDEEILPEIMNITLTASNYSMQAKWDMPSNISKVYFIETSTNSSVYSTTGSVTMYSLQPNQEFNFMLIGMDLNNNVTKPVKVKGKTLTPDVNFYGIGISALDDSLSSVTSGLNTTITWDKEIVGRTLRIYGGSNKGPSQKIVQFLDENDNIVGTVSKREYGLKNYYYYGQSLLINSTSSNEYLYALIPDGAVKINMHLTNVADFRLLPESEAPQYYDFKATQNSNSIQFDWTKDAKLNNVTIVEVASGRTFINTETTYTLTGLLPNTEYNFAVYGTYSGSEAYQATKLKLITVKTLP